MNIPKLRLTLSVSLDGFAAAPNQSVENPIGVGGMRLFEWFFGLKVWREMQGLEGGEDNEVSRLVAAQLADAGATIMGRNMFGGGPGPWNKEKPWTGWWGENPPYHNDVFVLTHHAREPLVMKGGTTFHFVTDGIESALAQARKVCGGKPISLAGGATAARQYLAAGLVDEMRISLVPILLGQGERLFEGLGDDLHGLKLVKTIAAPDVTHLMFSR